MQQDRIHRAQGLARRDEMRQPVCSPLAGLCFLLFKRLLKLAASTCGLHCLGVMDRVTQGALLGGFLCHPCCFLS